MIDGSLSTCSFLFNPIYIKGAGYWFPFVTSTCPQCAGTLECLMRSGGALSHERWDKQLRAPPRQRERGSCSPRTRLLAHRCLSLGLLFARCKCCTQDLLLIDFFVLFCRAAIAVSIPTCTQDLFGMLLLTHAMGLRITAFSLFTTRQSVDYCLQPLSVCVSVCVCETMLL